MSRTLLLIPNYNDAERLEPFLKELLSTLPARFSILISDDGSTPDQKIRLTTLLGDLQSSSTPDQAELLKPLFADQNTGKGGAVYRGWDQAQGFALLAFADADGAVNAREIVRAESFFSSGACDADALFGSRVKMLGRTVHRSLLRHLSGRIFATLVSELAALPAYDTQCGLKILTAEAYQKIRRHLCTQGFAFDVELALLLLKSGSSIMEFPIDWQDVSGSKVHLLRDSVRMTIQVLKMHSRVASLTFETDISLS